MARNSDNWKIEQQRDEVCLLADLPSENCVEEMFRPYLSSVIAPTAQQPTRELASAPAPPEQRTTTGQMFEVVVRSFTNLWQLERTDALVQQDQGQPAVPAREQESALPVENFVPVIMPRTVAPLSPPLPHEVREELLELRTEVMQATRTRNLQTLMICGVESGVGTSFVAGHLSRSLAEYAQMKVAFLTLVASREKKVSWLARRSVALPLQLLLRRTELPNLIEIASSNGTISLTELLCHCSTAEVLRQIKAEFDLIVIDAPTIAMYGEAAALAALMDGVILVAEPDVTLLRRVDRAHRRLRKARAEVLGMVFNRQRRP